MSLTTVHERLDTQGDGASTDFTFPYVVTDSDDLKVYLEDIATGVPTIQTEGIHYDLIGTLGSASGVTIRFRTAPPATKKIWRYLIPEDFTQQIATDGSTAVSPTDFVAFLDRAMSFIQALATHAGLKNRNLEDTFRIRRSLGDLLRWDLQGAIGGNAGEPVNGTDLATKNYVVNQIAAGVTASGTWTHGSLEMTTATGTATTAATPIKISSTLTTLGSNTSEVDMPANNRLRYTGTTTKVFRATAHGTIDMASADVNVKLGIYKNGSLVGTATEFDYENAGKKNDFNVVADGFTLANGDYVELWVETDSNETVNVTKLTLSLDAIEQQGFVVADSDLPDPAALADNSILVVDSAAWTSLQAGIVKDLLDAAGLAKGDVLAYNGANLVRVGVGSNNQILIADSTASTGVAWGNVTTVAADTPDQGHIYGLTLSNGTDADHDIDIAVGNCANFSGSLLVTLGSALTKQIDATWTEGTGAGGDVTGGVTINETYHVILITKNTDGTVDAMFDTSPTGANVPTGWTAVRRIGSVVTDGSSNIIKFYQRGDVFLWDIPVVDDSTANPGTSRVTVTLTLPTDIIVDAIVYALLLDDGSAGQAYLDVGPLKKTDVAISVNDATHIIDRTGSTTHKLANQVLEVETDTLGRICYRLSASVAETNVTINTRGWIDRRGKDS